MLSSPDKHVMLRHNFVLPICLSLKYGFSHSLRGITEVSEKRTAEPRSGSSGTLPLVYTKLAIFRTTLLPSLGRRDHELREV